VKEEGQNDLEVHDNGRGMTDRDLSGARSLGLLGMRETGPMLDGEVNIIARQARAPRWAFAFRSNGTPTPEQMNAPAAYLRSAPGERRDRIPSR